MISEVFPGVEGSVEGDHTPGAAARPRVPGPGWGPSGCPQRGLTPVLGLWDWEAGEGKSLVLLLLQEDVHVVLEMTSQPG